MNGDVRIRTLFFASYKELLGTGELQVDLPEGSAVSDLVSALPRGDRHEGSAVSDLVSALRSRGGAFTVLPAAPAVAVNLTYSDPTSLLSDGDEVALIPPVAGG